MKEFLTDFLDNLVSRLVEDDISNKMELPGEDVAPACLAFISKVDHSVALPTDKKKTSAWYHFHDEWMDPKTENKDSYYPWLVELPSKDGCDRSFICKYCSAFPKSAYASHKNQWILGWKGGKDGYREHSLELHDGSNFHNTCKKLFLANVASAVEREEANSAKPTVRNALTARLEEWKIQAIESKKSSLITKISAANFVGKEKIAGKKFGSILELLKEVGANVGGTHMNYEGYQIFLSLISDWLDELDGKDIDMSRFGCFSSDTSDDHSHASQESIFFRVVVDGIPKNIFIGLEELDFQDAHNLWEQIKKRLAQSGLSVATLKKKLVAVCFDGASVNMGVLNGVQSLVKRDIGNWVLVMHCVNHSFELALLDMKKNDEYLQEFEEVIKQLFSIYHWSPKLTRELQMLALVFEEEFEKFAALKNMRWSSSSFCAMTKLKKTLPNVSSRLEALAASNHKHADNASSQSY